MAFLQCRDPPPRGRSSQALLGRAHNHASAVSKILQIAQQSEQHVHSRPASPPNSSLPPVFAQHRASSSAHVQHQRATYPGMSAFEDEPDAEVYDSSPPRGPPKVYSNMAPTSLSTPGNVPATSGTSQIRTSRLQASQRPSSPDTGMPRVFARPAASQSPPPVLAQTRRPPPDRRVQQAAAPAIGGQPHYAQPLNSTSVRHGRASSANSPPPRGSSLATGGFLLLRSILSYP